MRRFLLWIILVIVFAVLVCAVVYFTRTNPVNYQELKRESVCVSGSESESQICKFLNFKTPFSIDEINHQILNRDDFIFSKLGHISNSKAEGILLGYYENRDTFLLVVGFDAQGDSRLAVPIRIPISVFEDVNNPVGLILNRVSSRNLSKSDGFSILKKRDEIVLNLNSLVNQVIVLMFNNESLNQDDLDYLNQSKSGKQLSSALERQIITTRALLEKINNNGLGDSYTDLKSDLVQIYSMDDLSKVNLEKLPIVTSIIANLDSNED